MGLLPSAAVPSVGISITDGTHRHPQHPIRWKAHSYAHIVRRWIFRHTDGYRSSMKNHQPTQQLIEEALRERRCAVGHDERQRRTLYRRYRAGILTCPYRNVYAPNELWKSLTPNERHMHVARALQQLHPHWGFAALTASTAHGFDSSYELHKPLRITIVSEFHPTNHQYRKLERIVIPDAELVRTSDLYVTTPQRTLIDCSQRYPFIEVLPMMNSAMRMGIPIEGLPVECARLGFDATIMERLCRYATPLCENGGESKFYALVINLGFVAPKLQYPFPNPQNPRAPYRADFVWFTKDGDIVVVEFDGMGKYAMNNATRDDIKRHVTADFERERHIRRHARDIYRFTYDDLSKPMEVKRRLLAAGVPLDPYG